MNRRRPIAVRGLRRRTGAIRWRLVAVIGRCRRRAGARRRWCRAGRAARVRRVGTSDPVVAVALVAGVVVRASRLLALRVLVVGLADAAGARLASCFAVAVAVARGRAVTRRAVRTVRALTVRPTGVLVRVARRLRLCGVTTRPGRAGAVVTRVAGRRRRCVDGLAVVVAVPVVMRRRGVATGVAVGPLVRICVRRAADSDEARPTEHRRRTEHTDSSYVSLQQGRSHPDSHPSWTGVAVQRAPVRVRWVGLAISSPDGLGDRVSPCPPQVCAWAAGEDHPDQRSPGAVAPACTAAAGELLSYRGYADNSRPLISRTA